jgi:hypothetical protein
MTTKAPTLTFMAFCATLTFAWAQTNKATTAAAAAAAPPALSSMEQTLKDIKQPTDWLSWGGDLRLRNEYFNNAQTLTSDPALNVRAPLHSQDYFRFRSRMWVSVTPVETLSINGRLAAEPREWMEPSSSANFRGNQGLEWRYGIVDNLNVQWKKPFDLPATLTVGRQDIFLGDGFLVGDGTPLDGSWTFFMDAARLTYQLEDLKTTIDAIGLLQYNKPDQWLPTLGPSSDGGAPAPYALTDQNEKGAVLWIANKTVPEVNVDTYFMFKNDIRVNGAAGTFGDNANIYTMGGRLSGVVLDNWKYSVEGAYQTGQKQDPWLIHSSEGAVGGTEFHHLDAFAVNSRLSYLFKDQMNNQVFFAYQFLSGDNPNTGNDEMFDVMWGRWPQWSELYIPYSYIPETRTGQFENLHRLGPGWSFTPLKDLDFSLTYDVLLANQEIPTRANAPNAFSNNGTMRGQYLQAILRYKFSKHMSGHLWSEFVFPGHYYSDTEQTMTFLRAELLFTL